MEISDIELKFAQLDMKDNTQKNYLRSFKLLIKEVYDGKRPENKMFETDAFSVITFITKVKGDLAQKNILNGLIKCFKALEIDTSLYDKMFLSLSQKINSTNAFSLPNEKEQEQRVEMKELIRLRDEWKVKIANPAKVRKTSLTNKKSHMYYVILCLYSMLPPLRGEDYFNSYLFIDSSKENIENKNYLCLTKKQLILKTYKTEHQYGIRTIDVPDELNTILTDFKNKYNFTYVMCTSKGEKCSSSNFGKLITRALGRDPHESSTGSQMLRKCYVAEKYGEGISNAEKSKLATIMAHSIGTAHIVYNKFNIV